MTPESSIREQRTKHKAQSTALLRNLWITVLLVLLSVSPAIAQENLRFTFGHTEVGSNYKYVRSDSLYSRESGYGFEPGANIWCVQEKSGLERPGYCTSDKPFYFSVALPEGNYQVRITF